MNRKILITASLATLMATGALAQTTAPAPAPVAPAPQAAPATPATPAPARTTAAMHGEMTTGKIVGISIYAPTERAAAAPTTAPATTAAPATTGSTAPGATAMGTSAPAAMTVSVVTDEQWRSMRDQHESIGKIDDLVIGQDGRISQAIVGVGGFLGIGEKKVALQLADVKLMRSEDGTLFGIVMRTKQQLQDMPEFTASRS
ncbi:PRC-barrel domain-containing protein [Phreatobacter sp.]|uniref:PRC-barrel domain-containing protein n=1 Tax=Phreatobacter sp. TaxID=1966341 RepID=UPI003F6F11B5